MNGNLHAFLSISDDVREKMKNRYLSNPDYNFEKVNRASMACGPMVKWAIAQVNHFVQSSPKSLVNNLISSGHVRRHVEARRAIAR